METNNHAFKQLLKFAQQGIAAELQLQQQHIMARHSFGETAVLNPEYYHPDRKGRSILELQESLDKLQALWAWANDLLNTVEEFEFSNLKPAK